MGAHRQEDSMPHLLDHHLTDTWTAELTAMDARLAPHVGRTEVRDRVGAYVRGLLSGAERKNGWQLAEDAGDATPYAMQHLLGRAVWDADAVRDTVRDAAMDTLATDCLL